jgi:hypothetical protein
MGSDRQADAGAAPALLPLGWDESCFLPWSFVDPSPRPRCLAYVFKYCKLSAADGLWGGPREEASDSFPKLLSRDLGVHQCPPMNALARAERSVSFALFY